MFIKKDIQTSEEQDMEVVQGVLPPPPPPPPIISEGPDCPQ